MRVVCWSEEGQARDVYVSACCSMMPFHLSRASLLLLLPCALRADKAPPVRLQQDGGADTAAAAA